DQELPTDGFLYTRSLEDGPDRLLIRARCQSGHEGIEEIPFRVHNCPGISVSGLSPPSTRRGEVRFTIDAFSSDDPFDPRRAEARSSIPTWVWVLSLFVVAWAVWYAARMWDVPAQFSHSPTFSNSEPSRQPSRPYHGSATTLMPARSQSFSRLRHGQCRSYRDGRGRST